MGGYQGDRTTKCNAIKFIGTSRIFKLPLSETVLSALHILNTLWKLCIISVGESCKKTVQPCDPSQRKTDMFESPAVTAAVVQCLCLWLHVITCSDNPQSKPGFQTSIGSVGYDHNQ